VEEELSLVWCLRHRKIELRRRDGELPPLRRVRRGSLQDSRRFGSEVSVDGNDGEVGNPGGGSGPVYGTRIGDSDGGYRVGNPELHGRDR